MKSKRIKIIMILLLAVLTFPVKAEAKTANWSVDKDLIT